MEKYIKLLQEKKNTFFMRITQQSFYWSCPIMNNLFDIRHQASRVGKALSDCRSWKNKATAVGLQNAYENTYKPNSLIIHSTTYSLSSRAGFEKDEKYFLLRMVYMFVENILKELSEFQPLTKKS